MTSNHTQIENQQDEWLQSLRWAGDHLELLDQRQLPEEVVYLNLNTSKEVWEAIRHLKVRGAPAIGIAAAFGLYLGMRSFASSTETEAPDRFREELLRQADYLATSRPTAVNLFWALDRMKKRAEQQFREFGIHAENNADGNSNRRPGQPDLDTVKLALLDEAMQIQSQDEETNRRIGEYSLTLLEEGMGVLTHCNAGGLATAKYGTALAPLYLAKERGIHLKVFADETRPVLQGARLTAFELQQAGIDVTLICDNMAGMVMSKGWVQAVIVGTDRVAANGDVANKIGTYSVAVLAKAHGIPFYVACPLSTIDLNMSSGQDIPIEERDELEITEGFGKRTAPLGIKVYNPAFDVTPYEYVTAIITEKGVVCAPYSENLPKLFES